MSSPDLSRRQLLAAAGSTAAAIGLSARSARAVRGANERISIGVIGCGGRGTALMGEVHKNATQHNVVITAVCDVWKINLDATVKRVKDMFGGEPRASSRFQEILKLDDIDAVIIATPDFAHTPIMIEALKAGKDVYVEKPMSLEVAGANQAMDLAREKQRVVQVGTQRRSEGRFKSARKELAGQVIGQVNRISAAMDVNSGRWDRAFDDCKAADVDWDAYLLNREPRPFDPRLLRRWHLYKMCTNGLSGLWMAHYSDAVHMITGAKYPRSAVGHGNIYVWHDGREHDDTFHALLDYPEGFLMSWGMGLGNASGIHFTVNGTGGTMDLEKWTVSGEGGAGPAARDFAPRKIDATGDESHMGNWLTCLRTREKPNADIEYGHQHAVATIMAAEARYSGRRQIYDPAKREIRPG